MSSKSFLPFQALKLLNQFSVYVHVIHISYGFYHISVRVRVSGVRVIAFLGARALSTYARASRAKTRMQTLRRSSAAQQNAQTYRAIYVRMSLKAWVAFASRARTDDSDIIIVISIVVVVVLLLFRDPSVNAATTIRSGQEAPAPRAAG